MVASYLCRLYILTRAFRFDDVITSQQAGVLHASQSYDIVRYWLDDSCFWKTTYQDLQNAIRSSEQRDAGGGKKKRFSKQPIWDTAGGGGYSKKVSCIIWGKLVKVYGTVADEDDEKFINDGAIESDDDPDKYIPKVGDIVHAWWTGEEGGDTGPVDETAGTSGQWHIGRIVKMGIWNYSYPGEIRTI